MAQSKRVLYFRWAVFILAGFYCLRTILFSPYDAFGGPFRYLTIWALFLSGFCAYQMLNISLGRSTKRWDVLVSATAVTNAMVVIMYWRLFFADASSVTEDGKLGVWWLEFYLHGLGAALQWIDSLFIHRSFRRLFHNTAAVAAVLINYLVWSELVQRPLNDVPMGSVTSGLPYPFLNDLAFSDRVIFYCLNIGVAVVVLLIFSAVALMLRRRFPREEAP